jgi:hypothetical protein
MEYILAEAGRRLLSTHTNRNKFPYVPWGTTHNIILFKEQPHAGQTFHE